MPEMAATWSCAYAIWVIIMPSVLSTITALFMGTPLLSGGVYTKLPSSALMNQNRQGRPRREEIQSHSTYQATTRTCSHCTKSASQAGTRQAIALPSEIVHQSRA